MSRSAGPGYPLNFRCLKLARTWPRTSADDLVHHEELTGRTKRTPFNGKGHPRKSWISFEYKCSCGHVGWSSHIDLQRDALRQGIIKADDPRIGGRR